jgi:hypothetical protein
VPRTTVLSEKMLPPAVPTGTLVRCRSGRLAKVRRVSARAITNAMLSKDSNCTPSRLGKQNYRLEYQPGVYRGWKMPRVTGDKYWTRDELVRAGVELV